MDLKYRRYVGEIERGLYPGYSSCKHCGRPWKTCRGHATPYTDSGNSLCFPLCEDCFDELSIDERIPYYRELVDEWMSYGYETYNGQSWDNLWEILERNIRNGL